MLLYTGASNSMKSSGLENFQKIFRKEDDFAGIPFHLNFLPKFPDVLAE